MEYFTLTDFNQVIEIKKYHKSSYKIETICPICGKKSLGTLIYKDRYHDKVNIKINCPEHPNIYPFNKNSKLYFSSKKIVEKCLPNSYSKFKAFDDRYLKFATHIQIDITTRCNLNCKFCFAEQNNEKDISWEIIEKNLKRIKSKPKPCVVLIGGEPTLRKDLPTIIKKIRELGFPVKLATNGIKLKDMNYLKKLMKAGLDWVVLQFDGFSSKIYSELRGKELLEVKLKVLQNLEKLNIRTQLSVMVDKFTNLDQIGQILKFAFVSNHIFWVSFYPHSFTSHINQSNNCEDSTFLNDIFTKMQNIPNVDIQLRDIICLKRIWTFLYLLMRKNSFRPRTCHYPLILFKLKDRIYPLNKLLDLRFSLRNLSFIFKLIKNIPNFLQYSKSKISNEFLFLSIEKFYDIFNLDLREVKNCHNLYLTNKGFIPVCLYNSLYRGK